MRESQLVIQELNRLRKEKDYAALVTIIKVKGSAYRREGTKMLVSKYGEMTGSISGGGCLEPDVVEIAKTVICNGGPIIKHYDMDEDLVWGLGLGCPGSVDVLIEPIFPERTNKEMNVSELDNTRKMNDDKLFDKWVSSLTKGKLSVLVKLLNSSDQVQHPQSNLLFVSSDKDTVGSLGNKNLNQIVIKKAFEKMNEKNPKSETYHISLSDGKWIEVFFDINIPPTNLIVFGAGHDAIPLVKFAIDCGFQTTVVDSRRTYATNERFPGANIVLTKPENAAEVVPVTNRTYIIIMNHHLERDKYCLHFALESAAPYVGVLGPVSRCKRVLDSLQKEEIDLSDKQLLRLYNPVGLNIGSESPEEIAISILGEILAIRNGHAGGFLSGTENIHSPTLV